MYDNIRAGFPLSSRFSQDIAWAGQGSSCRALKLTAFSNSAIASTYIFS
jgi:hypothetical protein